MKQRNKVQLVDLLERPEMTLIVSLPRNDPTLARAAIAGGAETLKVHINLTHDAAGSKFGSLAEERQSLEAILAAANGVPVGIVMGAAMPQQVDEYKLIERMGFDFVDMHAHNIPAWMWLDDATVKVVAVDHTYTSDELIALNALAPDIVEAAIIAPEGYGKPISVRDLTHLQLLRDIVDWPVILPTQRGIKPEDLPLLARLGIDGLMIGAVVTGSDPTTVETITASFREAIDSFDWETPDEEDED